MNKPQTIEKSKPATVYTRKPLRQAFVAVNEISAGDQEQQGTSKRKWRPARIDRHFAYHRNYNEFHNDDEC